MAADLHASQFAAPFRAAPSGGTRTAAIVPVLRSELRDAVVVSAATVTVGVTVDVIGPRQ